MIGSVANYLKRHGWQRGRPIAERWPAATARVDDVQPLLRSGLKPEISADRLRQVGFDTEALAAATSDDSLASVMVLEGSKGPEVWVGYGNFYSITRYNHSALYALAVMQLAGELGRVNAVMRSMAPLPGLLMVLMLAAVQVGCASSAPSGVRPYSASTDGPGDRRRVHRELTERVRNLPKSRSGNPYKYSVFGREYEVMDSAKGHVEEGLASWYGRKFHGRLTSSGEPYDMHAMTAAHKHLPLPTFVRVTRTDTGASLVVKVNDRGPFVDERIIDLSYAAAIQMDMLDAGTVPVRIEALSSHEGEVLASEAGVSSSPKNSGIDQAASAGEPDAQPSAQPSARPGAQTRPVLQFGAFSRAENAEALQAKLNPVLDIPIIIVEDVQGGLYRVLSAPLYDQGSLDAAMASLANAGIRHEAVLRRSP